MTEERQGAAVDWAAVRQAYEAGGETVAAIRARFGLSERDLRTVREREDWLTRLPVARRDGSGIVDRGGVTSLGARLLRNLRLQIARLERRAGVDGDAAAEARTLAELIRGWEMMARREKKLDDGNKAAGGPGEKKNKNNDGRGAVDVAWLRAEIKRRLQALGGPEES